MIGRVFAVLVALALVLITWSWYGGRWALAVAAFYVVAAVCSDCKAHRLQHAAEDATDRSEES